ncbi:hypothetical protein Gotur_024513 [Gossypium turneri]
MGKVTALYSLVVTLALLILFLISYANHGCRLKLRSSFSFSNPTCHEFVAFDILVAQSSVAGQITRFKHRLTWGLGSLFGDLNGRKVPTNKENHIPENQGDLTAGGRDLAKEEVESELYFQGFLAVSG